MRKEKMRRVKKFKIELKSCSLGDSCPMPRYSIAYHRGLHRTIGLFIKGLLENGMLEDRDLIDWLMYHKVISAGRLMALAGSFDRDAYKEEK